MGLCVSAPIVPPEAVDQALDYVFIPKGLLNKNSDAKHCWVLVTPDFHFQQIDEKGQVVMDHDVVYMDHCGIRGGQCTFMYQPESRFSGVPILGERVRNANNKFTVQAKGRADHPGEEELVDKLRTFCERLEGEFAQKSLAVNFADTQELRATEAKQFEAASHARQARAAAEDDDPNDCRVCKGKALVQCMTCNGSGARRTDGKPCTKCKQKGMTICAFANCQFKKDRWNELKNKGYIQ